MSAQYPAYMWPNMPIDHVSSSIKHIVLFPACRFQLYFCSSECLARSNVKRQKLSVKLKLHAVKLALRQAHYRWKAKSCWAHRWNWHVPRKKNTVLPLWIICELAKRYCAGYQNWRASTVTKSSAVRPTVWKPWKIKFTCGARRLRATITPNHTRLIEPGNQCFVVHC